MNSRWTWNQYGVFRVLFGAYLLVHFAHLLPWATELFSSAGMLADRSVSPLVTLFPNVLGVLDHPAFILAFVGSGVGASLLLMSGRHDRKAALWMWFVLACLFGRNPLIANPSLPVVGWLLLFHALLPARRPPWDAAQPGTSAAIPRPYVVAVWVLLAVAYSYSGLTKLFSDAWVQGETVRWVLENPLARDTWLRTALLATPEWVLQGVTLGVLVLELVFAPLALSRRARPWIWLGMLLVQFGFLFLLNFADLTTPMLLLHLLTFDPAWVRPRAPQAGAKIYYDGDCGLCHAWVRFVMAEDRNGAFGFVPLQGNAARLDLPEVAAQDDYESLLIKTPDGKTLEKFAAVRYVFRALGGLWGAVGLALAVVPQRAGDALYILVAKNRRRLFAAPPALCPILPASFATRFDR